jgi:transcriptional regulator
MAKKTIELVQGTLEFLILKTLSRDTPMRGFNILQWIYEVTDEALLIEEGSLYPALHRMEKRGWIKADWATSEKGRRAKYYKLSASGKKRLSVQEAQWNLYTAAVDKVVSSAEGAT